jgi:drug/metabolite transporter (DMT)-like permease
LGERPGLIQWIGIPVATLGVLFLSLEFNPGGQARLIGWGPMFAVVGVVTGAVSNAGLRIPVRDIGPLQAIITQRFFTVAYLLVVIAFVIRAGRAGKARVIDLTVAPTTPIQVPASPSKSFAVKALILLTVGLLDAVAFVAFAEGLARAPAWLIGLLSQSGRVIAVAGGYLLFRERLRATQWIGVFLTVAGLVLAVL